MASASFVTWDRAAGYGLLTGGGAAPAYPETDLALRDRIASCAATPVARGVMASAAITAAGLYRRAGEPGPRVCRGTLAGAGLLTVAVHLRDADRAGLDFPDG